MPDISHTTADNQDFERRHGDNNNDDDDDDSEPSEVHPFPTPAAGWGGEGVARAPIQITHTGFHGLPFSADRTIAARTASGSDDSDNRDSVAGSVSRLKCARWRLRLTHARPGSIGNDSTLR